MTEPKLQVPDWLAEPLGPDNTRWLQAQLDNPDTRYIAQNAATVVFMLILSAIVGAVPQALLAIGIQMAVYLGHGLPNLSEKYYDSSGSVTHLVLIVSSMLSTREKSPRQLINAVFGVMWLTRLGSFLYTRIMRDAKDTRFDRFKSNKYFFLVPWVVQALWVFLVDLPIVILNKIPQDDTGVSFLDVVGWTIFVVGFTVELIADTQKFVFRNDPANKEKYITHGLWAYSRHPNYFGEIALWVGLCISGSSSFSGVQFLAWLSPAFTTNLLLRVSGVPMVEKAGEKKWGKDPKYRHYMEHTSCIIPSTPASEVPMRAASQSDDASEVSSKLD